MKRDLLPHLAIGGAVLALILAGLAVVGGPGQGQAERRDDRRLNDLKGLADFVRCTADRSGKVVPAALQPDPVCAAEPLLNDPFADTPFGYEKLDDTSFRLCADFESPGTLRVVYVHLGEFDPKTGCLTARLKD